MAAPLIQGASADVDRLRAELAQRSRGDPASADALWREARAATLAHSARLLVASLEQEAPPVPAAAHQARPPTAGVSYVVHTESRQLGSDGLPQLPHLGERDSRGGLHME